MDWKFILLVGDSFFRCSGIKGAAHDYDFSPSFSGWIVELEKEDGKLFTVRVPDSTIIAKYNSTLWELEDECKKLKGVFARRIIPHVKKIDIS